MKMDQVGAWVVALLVGSMVFIGLTWWLSSTKSHVEQLVEEEKTAVIELEPTSEVSTGNGSIASGMKSP